MDEQKWESRLKILTQVAGISFVIVYVVGFLTTSIYHVRYGIPSFNLLRPKIVSAGVLFAGLLALPVWELASLYGWIKFPSKVIPEAGSEKESAQPEVTPFWIRLYVPTLKLFLFLSASFGISFFVNLFMTGDFKPATGAWVIGCTMICGTMYIWGARLPRKRQVYGLGLVLLTLPIYAFVTWKTYDRGFQLFLVWFLICGVTVQLVWKAKKDPANFFSAALHNIVLNFLLPLVFFAAYLYPRITPVVGGGAPVPITIYCADVPPFAKSNEIKAKLLDETDLGFYLLVDADDKHAVFLPRVGVRAVKFGTQ